ncbi:MAG TPA: 3-phosphoshikimate 1-carboxyvinyltransferase, partial [Candidatus Paceibacterota bacterium]|nr:3-phosphoshikimate 1-carboxyvinyltransferase [Candidatus Paceibacterota bacterium]
MGWPDWIEIIPLAGPVSAQVTVPGSKSITNRALVLAALAEGETILEGALWSEDTRVMAQALQAIGFRVAVESDPAEPANRTITVVGQGGRVPAGGTPENPRDLFVGNAGTAARFLTALVCLGQGVYRLRGVPRMHERPQAGLLAALRHLGYRIDAAGDRLPLAVHGGGPRPGACRVSVAQSSQFASALLLCAEAGGWSVRIEGDHSEEQSYIEMTRQMAARFPRCGGRF